MSNSPMTTHGAPSWIAHQGPDPAAARRFYERVIEWRVEDLPMQDGSAYPGILVGDRPAGGFDPRPHPDGGWLVYVTVDDVARRFAVAIDAGATSVWLIRPTRRASDGSA